MESFFNALSEICITQIFSIFIVMYAVIDANGAIPVIIQLKEKGLKIKPANVAIISFFVLMAFLFVGEGLLKLFNVDIQSFAVAGALILLVLASEMIFDIEIFKNNSPTGSATIIPLVFPLVAGAGTITTMISLRAEYAIINLIIATALNMAYVYFVLRYLYLLQRLLGKGGVYILRKFFGIILLAMAVKLFSSNLLLVIQNAKGL